MLITIITTTISLSTVPVSRGTFCPCGRLEQHILNTVKLFLNVNYAILFDPLTSPMPSPFNLILDPQYLSLAGYPCQGSVSVPDEEEQYNQSSRLQYIIPNLFESKTEPTGQGKCDKGRSSGFLADWCCVQEAAENKHSSREREKYKNSNWYMD
ncbi:hypothetical protein EOD39_8852 [Acipenser ruthenus]|uniref:Uncharacterized protein n=1 Tax=Acipenser ruthenus TaxID=7906 RepID=A0A444U2E3_ACIRT|nr:hypothetical protein EOD39_8852 [Acipenser ruthenus]